MSAPVKDCPQPDYPIRERAYTPEQIAAMRIDASFNAVFAPMSAALAEAEAQADRIHAAWEASNADD